MKRFARKIELYENFINDFFVCIDDPIDGMLKQSTDEAIRRKDLTILRLLLHLDSKGEWYKKVITQERAGIKTLPDYLWRIMADVIDRWADELCETHNKLPLDAPETEQEKRIKRKIEILDEISQGKDDKSLDGRMNSKEWDKLISQLESLRLRPIQDEIDSPHLNTEIFIRDYLHGKLPENMEQIYAARRIVANEMRKYAKMLREAEA